MPDYTSILKRSVSTLPDQSPAMREAVYQRARAALARQLTAVEPPLSTREIESQHQELENAVRQVEAGFSTQKPATPPPPVPAAASPAASPQVKAPQGQTSQTHAPQNHAPQNQAPQAQAPQTQAKPSKPKDRPATADDLHAASVVPAAAKPGERDFFFKETRPGRDAGAGPSFGEETDNEPDEYEETDPFYEEERRPSRLPLLLAVLAVVVVFGGIGAFFYTQGGDLLGWLGGANDERTLAATEGAPSETSEIADSDAKRLDRLTNGNGGLDTGFAEPEVGAPAANVRDVTPGGPAVETEANRPADIAPTPVETARVEQPASPSASPGTQSLVAQRAIYYEQGAEGTPGRATEGTVAWAETNGDKGAAIQATLELPEQNVTTTVTISRNSDPGLPASHLVEVSFSGPLNGSTIQRVPAIVLKSTEQARGQPLAGAAVPVTEDLFWIALSNDAEQTTRNLQLLREGSWFDVPILFEDGTRALLTFEKGIPGDKVFETVLAAWSRSG